MVGSLGPRKPRILAQNRRPITAEAASVEESITQRRMLSDNRHFGWGHAAAPKKLREYSVLTTVLLIASRWDSDSTYRTRACYRGVRWGNVLLDTVRNSPLVKHKPWKMTL